jgi:hypothetical protein
MSTTAALAPPTSPTLQSLFGVTTGELASRMNTQLLLSAAHDDAGKFSSFLRDTQWPQLSNQVAGHVCNFLSQNLVDIFSGAWNQYAELRKYAAQTLADPHTTASVALATHGFTYTLAPSIEVQLDHVDVAKIPFALSATFAVTALELALKAGAVAAISSGTCDCSAELLCAQTPIWSRTLKSIDLPGILHLTHPIPLT